MVIQVSGTRIIGPNTVVDPDPDPDPVVTMLMGCSTSNENHGGTDVWDGWRAYRKDTMYQYANRTGSRRPTFLAYSETGANLGGTSPSYSAVRQHVIDELNEFYYLGGATSQVRSDRWGIQLYWSNGNENSDKGALAEPHTQTGINNYVTSQRALYDGVHYIDPSTGQRRFPDAYAGSNPTQEHERLGIVQAWLHPSARYHDFVMWSMYPPGRGVNDPTLAVNPRWDWPSFDEDRMIHGVGSTTTQRRQQGFLIRCFYRTYQAQAYARDELNDPDFSLQISCGETGMASDPDDRTTRPYYAVHALAHGMLTLSEQYELAIPFACWWDNKTSEVDPHNVLSDEPPTSDHLSAGTGAAAGNNSTATNPSTREAWQNHLTYNHRRGGTHPAAWAGNPKSSWNQTGTPL